MTKPVTLSDLELPKSLVFKLIKDHHDDQILLHKDSKLAFIKSATVFISYLTATAQDISNNQGSGRTLSANHILKALDEIIDEEYLEDWKRELEERLQQWKLVQTKNKSAAAAVKTTKNEGENNGNNNQEREKDDMLNESTKEDMNNDNDTQIKSKDYSEGENEGNDNDNDNEDVENEEESRNENINEIDKEEETQMTVDHVNEIL